MKILGKSIFFSLLALMAVAVLMTSCEQESFIGDDVEGLKTETSTDVPLNVVDIESRETCNLCPQVVEHPGPGCKAEWRSGNTICIEPGGRVLLRVLDCCTESITGYNFNWSTQDGQGFDLGNSGRPHRYTALSAGTYTVVVTKEGNPDCSATFTFIVTDCG